MDISIARRSRSGCVEGRSSRPRLVGAALRCTLALHLGACAASTANSGGAAPTPIDPLDRIGAAELFNQGEQLATHGDPIRAEQYLSSAVQRGYPARKALPLLLRVCVASSRLGAALQYAAPYLRLHPDDYHLRYLVAAVQLGLGRPDEAQRELSRVLRDAPDYADAHYLLGTILRDQGAADAAAAEFAAHQRLNPNGLHGAEVAAWLREHEAGAPAPAPARDPEAAAPNSPPAAAPNNPAAAPGAAMRSEGEGRP